MRRRGDIGAAEASDGAGFRAETSDGTIDARFVVAATGPFQRPVVPPIVPDDAGLVQMHSSGYRNPDQLPDGAVLVVGAGSSGVQIADELLRAGRRVYLSVGPHDRPPRRYRGRDFVWWLGVLGSGTRRPRRRARSTSPSRSAGRTAVTPSTSAIWPPAAWCWSAGRTRSTAARCSSRQTWATIIAQGDANYLSLLDEADAYVARNGLDLPEEPEARVLGPVPDCVTEPVLELDLAGAGVTSIIWATGFAVDYGWLQVDAFDESGRPSHRRGVSPEPGVYFLGLPWLARRGSSFIWGVWHDASYLADHIAIQRGYLAYRPSEVPLPPSLVRASVSEGSR